MKVLVTGGVRSGKSRHAEKLLGDHADVTYVAAGPTPDREDADWAARIAGHQQRRPATWTTVETLDVATAIRRADAPVLVDCLGTWLTGLIDQSGLWEADEATVAETVDTSLQAILAAVEASADVVLVTNEVGLGVVPEHRSGRLFRDLLGSVNQRVAAACDEVHLVVAGRVLRL